MTTEEMASPGAEVEIVAPVESANETPEPAEPETSEVEQQPQEESKDDSDKSLKRLQRRVDRVTAARYQAEARAQQLEAQLAQYQKQAQTEVDEAPLSREEIQREIEQKARELRQMESVQTRSTQIRDDLVKEVGAETLPQILQAVTDEAGPLAYADGRWTPLGEAIADSDNPAKLLAYLGKNPETAEALNGLSAAQLGRRIARIEAEISKPAEQPKPSAAPKPLAPVKASSAPSTPSADSPDFMAWKLKQLASR